MRSMPGSWLRCCTGSDFAAGLLILCCLLFAEFMAARSDDSALLSLTLSLLARACLGYSGRLDSAGSDDDGDDMVFQGASVLMGEELSKR